MDLGDNTATAGRKALVWHSVDLIVKNGNGFCSSCTKTQALESQFFTSSYSIKFIVCYKNINT